MHHCVHQLCVLCVIHVNCVIEGHPVLYHFCALLSFLCMYNCSMVELFLLCAFFPRADSSSYYLFNRRGSAAAVSQLEQQVLARYLSTQYCIIYNSELSLRLPALLIKSIYLCKLRFTSCNERIALLNCILRWLRFIQQLQVWFNSTSCALLNK